MTNKKGSTAESRSKVISDVLYRPNLLLALIPAVFYVIVLSYYVRGFTMDDAYIGFRYVDNFISGNGLVFNPSERVEGITNIGWIILLIPFSYLIKAHIAAKILGAIFVVLTLIISYLIAVRMIEEKSDHLFALVVPVCIATQSSFIYFSLAGMETAFLSALLCLIVYLILENKSWSMIAVLCSISYLLHPECLLIFPIAVLFGLFTDRKQLSAQLISIIVFIALIAGYSLLRYYYYHDILPNTYYAKFTSLKSLFRNAHDYISKGFIVNIPGIFSGIAGITFLAAGVVFYWKRFRTASIFMAAIVFVGISFAIYAWQDWTTLPRYFAPYVPIAFILFWKAAGEFIKIIFPDSRGEKNAIVVTALLTMVIVFSGIGDLFRSIRSGVVDEYPWNVMTGKNLVEPAKWVEQNIPDNSIIATRRIGALSYYTSKKIFDYKYGLTDKKIARLVREHRRAFEYPDDPAIAEVWREKSPDYVFEDLPRAKEVAERANGTLEGFEIHSIKYRAIKTFTIGKDLYWVLFEKM